MDNNVKVKNGFIVNQGGKMNISHADLKGTAFYNSINGKAILQDVETDSRIYNEGDFAGTRIKIFLKNQKRSFLLVIVAVLLTIIGFFADVLGILSWFKGLI